MMVSSTKKNKEEYGFYKHNKNKSEVMVTKVAQQEIDPVVGRLHTHRSA